GSAAKIMTGAPIPAGADTIVRVEDTRPEGGDVVILRGGEKGAHIRRPGEDIRAGELVLERGRALTPADVGLLASIGKTLVLVRQRPRVAIVSTGNELVEADDAVAPGQVVNSNAYTLAAAVREAGGVPVPLPIARDTLADIRALLLQAARCDAILSTGGVSVGEFDYVKRVMDEIGVRRLFWRVAQKPGKPLTFGTLSGRPWFGLPGNPVSSLVCFYLYARPALRKMMGLTTLHLPTVEALLADDTRKAENLTEFIRCRLEQRDGTLVAASTGTQSSGVLRSMSTGQGLIVGPAESMMLAAASRVRVILLEGASADPPF
ncbi:MAG: molybdopterin molybdotransferase MoeA, partial [Candidatus Binatia bacterium]